MGAYKGKSIMKLEQNDISMLFSVTQIPDLFFTEYLTQSSGDFIKVYLYIVFLSKHGKDVKLNDMSKQLALPFKVIQDALKYWEDLGIITKKNTGYIVGNIQEVELYKLYKPKLSAHIDVEQVANNKYRASAIETINNSFFQGIMSPSWYNDIDLWFKKYQFDEQVMIALFRYCFERSALHRNYIQTVAEAWFNNNISNFNDLDLYFQKQEKLNKMKKDISKKLGFTRSLTQYEEAYIEKWVVEFGYSLDIIELALRKTSSKSNFGFDYIDKIICSWHDRNLNSVEAVKQFLIDAKNKDKSVKALEKKSYNNYEQRTYTDLDAMYSSAVQSNASAISISANSFSNDLPNVNV